MLGIYCRTSKERDFETSTISQQKSGGIEFAEKNNLEYQLFIDEGKSAFKISDFELDPFQHRPDFASLINDIKSKNIDKVWVWEISRLSRNDYASAFIFNVFEKYNIKLYIDKEEFYFTNPINKLNRVILGAISEYERTLIVNRTIRGSKEQFEKGRKTYHSLYGYVNSGRKTKEGKREYVIWEPVESEIETYKYILKRFNEGASLRKIVVEVFDMNNIKDYQFASYAVRMATILRKYQYTGYQLTEEGNDIFKRFRNYELSNIQALKDKKYWIKSIPYHLELISIDEWVDVSERLQIRGAKMNFSKQEKLIKANKDIGTGIINCGDCNARFYYKQQKTREYKDGHRNYYYTYFHNSGFHKAICKQLPNSFKVEYINEIFKLFYFYFLLVFDNRNELMNESQKNIKHQQIKVKEEINKNAKVYQRIEKQISKYQTALETTDDTEIIKVLAKNISQSNDKIDELDIVISKLKIENEKLSEQFSKNLLEITYYDVVEKVNNWFYNMSIEEQRNELIRIIQGCFIYNHYMIIDAGTIVFSFDINQHYVFDMELLNKMNEGEIFKKYFMEMKGGKDARKYNDKLIPNVNLNGDKLMKVRMLEYMVKNYGFGYDFVGKTNLISFVSLSGLYGFDINMPE
jgi:DNA invertase Pin-like site-specific DNA recombinase